jgi:hypothetical protein
MAVRPLTVRRFRVHAAETLPGLAAPVEGLMSMPQVMSWLTAEKLGLNRVEVENLFVWYGVTVDGEMYLDVSTFLGTLKNYLSGDDAKYYVKYPDPSSDEAHLSLSGSMHMQFDVQAKPFPKHWGVPPNAQMKGHDGIMRDLPGGYGRGNAPMFKWVQANLAKDKKATTDDRGNKPYKYGNYSL